MRISIFFFLFVGLLSTQCSKKVSDNMADTAKEEMSKVTDFRSTAPAPGEARPLDFGEFNRFELDNGLTVITVQNNKLPRVSYQLSLKHEAIKEGDKAGYVSMAGQLLNKGTKTKSKAEIDESIDFIGANLSASGYSMFGSSLTKHQDKLLDVMTDVLYNPTFPQEEFDKIKKQTLSGLAQAKSDPATIAANVSGALNFGKDHPYGEIETEETIENITIADCKAYYDSYFRPNNAYLTIVGDISPDAAKMKAEKYFGEWKAQQVTMPSFDDVDVPDSRQVAFANKDGAVQSVIRVTYPVQLMPGGDDAIKASVMNSILGGGVFSGRLMQNLREDKAYTYGARSSLSSDPIMGRFTASASVRNEVTDSSVTQFIYELERLRDEPVSQEDLDLVKNYMSGSFARSLESPQTLARFVLNTIRYDLPLDYYDTYLQKLSNVSVADVQAMAQKYIRPDEAYIVVVGNKDEVADKLARFDADGEVDFYDAEGNKIELVDVETPSDVTAQSVIEDYIDAIGGKDKLMAVKSAQTEMKADVMGQSMTMTMKQKDGMFYSSVNMQGMTVMEQKFDGSSASMEQMGQGTQVFTEGKEFNSMKAQAETFPQLSYFGDEYELELKGVENVDGKNVYKIAVTDAAGETTTQFYDMESSLLVKSVSSSEGPDGNPVTQTTELKDYKEVEGILFPHEMTITGAMPFPLTMKMESMTINPMLSDSDFTVK